MRFSILTGAVLASMTAASPIVSSDSRATAATAAGYSDYEIRNFAIHTSSSGQTTVSFNLRDPYKKANVAAPCYGSWSGDENPLVDSYVQCGNTALAFGFKSFKNEQQFVLQAQDSFVDNSVGDPPQNIVTTFAKTKFTSSSLTCVENSAGASTCTQKPFSKAVKVPVYAVIA